MLLNAILRALGGRCPGCFKLPGPGAMRHGMRLCCSQEHRDQHLKRGNLTKKGFGRAEGGGRCC